MGGRILILFFYYEYHYKIQESNYFSRRGHTNLITRSQSQIKYGQAAPRVEAGRDEKLIFNFIWPTSGGVPWVATVCKGKPQLIRYGFDIIA